MKYPFCLAALACALLVQGTAEALPEGAAYRALLDEGPIFNPVGSLTFTFSEQQVSMLSGGGWAVTCRYILSWAPADGAGFETFCSVDEVTWIGHHDCMQNSTSSFGTIVRRVPSAPCAGFDVLSVPHNIFQLVLGESSDVLSGMIQFTAASAHVTGIRALPGS